jgi:hypothetical protein
MKFTVPMVLPIVNELPGGVGCCLHIVLDDHNVEDKHIVWCVEHAQKQEHKYCEILGQILLTMSKTQRLKLAKRASY